MSTATQKLVVRDDQYNHDAFALLKTTFPLISVAAIQRVFREKNRSFPASYETLQSIQTVIDDLTVRALAEKRNAIISMAPFLARVSTIVLKWNRKPPAGTLSGRSTSPQLLHELEGKWRT